MSFDIVTNPLKPTITHDPQATLDYEWDLTALIDAEDALDTATFEVWLGSPTGPAVPGATCTLGLMATSTVWGWLSIQDVTQTGSDTVPTLLGQTLAVTCHYTTTGGRIDDRTLYFKIKDR